MSRLSLRIHNVPHLHERLLAELDAPRRHVHRAGEQIPNTLLFLGETQWPNSLFTVESPLGSQAKLSDHWKWLSDFLTKHDEILRNIASAGATLDLYFALEMPPGVTSFEITGACIGLLARHQLSVFCRVVSDSVFEEGGQQPGE
jgi:hypothetical protein